MFAKEAKKIANEAKAKAQAKRQEALNEFASKVFKTIKAEAEKGYFAADIPYGITNFTKEEVVQIFEPYGYDVRCERDRFVFRWF